MTSRARGRRPRVHVDGSPGPNAHWEVVFFQRHPDDDPHQAIPGREFLDSCPKEPALRLRAIVVAVAAAPPQRFSGGLMWRSMRGTLHGYHEARDRHGTTLYRLFCKLDHCPATGRNLLAILGGGSKPNDSAFSETFYKHVRALGDEYLSRSPRSVV